MGQYRRFPPYLSVAECKQNAAKKIESLRKKGQVMRPVIIEGRSIATTFWGKAWCHHLEVYSDYFNRLPRGRCYVRHGAVIDLQVEEGKITALVSGGSCVYNVWIRIAKVAATQWRNLVAECAGKMDTLIELLQGKFSTAVLQTLVDPEKGLFPHPKEIQLQCSCPDWATMCKHVAAVLYGVGARLDDKPEELFLLRQVDPTDLITQAGTATLTKTAAHQSYPLLDDPDLASLFGIEMGDGPTENRPNKKALKVLKTVSDDKNTHAKSFRTLKRKRSISSAL